MKESHATKPERPPKKPLAMKPTPKIRAGKMRARAPSISPFTPSRVLL